MKVFIYQILMAFLMINNEFLTNGHIWTKVLLKKNYLEYNKHYERFSVQSKYFCGNICEDDPLCKIWCYYDDITCILSSLIVSPNYKEKSNDSVKCYTRNRKDLAVGLTAYSTKAELDHMKIETTTDGIYFNDRFKSIKTTNPWILYDLERPAIISEIRIGTHWVHYSCMKIEIRIGDALSVNASLSSFNSLINIVDPCEYGKSIMHFKSKFPLTGRFVAVIQRGSDVVLILNYIEIDGDFI